MEILDLIKESLLLKLGGFYFVFIFLLWGLNLKKEKRYKQASNSIIVASYLVIIAIYFFKNYGVENLKVKERVLLFSLYYFSGVILVLILFLWKLIKKITTLGKTDDKTLWIDSPYERLEDGYYLKNHYKFIRTVVGIWAIIFGILAIVVTYLTISNIDLKLLEIDTQSLKIIPLFSVVAFILMLEIYWYLDGKEKNSKAEKEERQHVEEVKTESLKSFDELYRAYKQTWPMNVMASIHQKSKFQDKDNVVEENIKNKEVKEIYTNLQKKNYNVTPMEVSILTDLFDKKDTLITDSNYEEIAPFIFAYLEKSIMKGKKVLILAETDLYTNAENREIIKEWVEGCFQKYYKKSIRKIVTFEDWRNENNWDILIGTQSEIIRYQQDFIEKIQAEQNELKDLIIFVINEKLDEIAENILTLSILSNILNTHFKVNKNAEEGAQYIILSNGTANLKVAIDKNLGIDVMEYNVPSKEPKDLYGIIWKADPKKEYYTEIMEGVPKGELGIASTLSYLAWGYGFKDINFVEQKDLPYSTYESNMDSAKSYLKDRPIPKNSLKDSYRNIIINNPITALTKKSKNNILFIEDRTYNAPVLIKKFSSLGTDEAFVNIISENYLLRDYFIDNIDYFTNSPHYGYTPKIESNSYKVAAYLKELLTNTQLKVSEDDIKTEMMSIEQNIKNVEEELVKLFMNVYNIDILKMDYLSVETERVYNKLLNNFEEIKYYKLSADIAENAVFKWFDDFEIIDSGRKIYGMISREHIYQNYLKGQVHCFNGKSYIVENIDLNNKKINIVPTEKVKRIIYRNNDRINIESVQIKPKNIFTPTENGNYSLEKKVILADYEIETVGYYEFLGGISLRNQTYKYNSLEMMEEKIEREYKNGQILAVNLKTKNLEISNFNKVATTLAVLFNEIFRTVFPENYRYVKIFTFVPEEFYGIDSNLEVYEEGFSVPQYLAHILPSKVTVPKTEFKNVFEENNDRQINLYFVEDSHKDIGLIRAINDNFENILRLIQDYLNWVNDGEIPKKFWNRSEFKNSERLEYLKYGLDTLAPELDLKELTHVLNKVLEDNKFTDARKRYYEKINSDAEKEDEFDREYAYLKSKIQ